MIYNNIDSDSNNNYIRRRGGYYNNYQPHDEIIRRNWRDSYQYDENRYRYANDLKKRQDNPRIPLRPRNSGE